MSKNLSGTPLEAKCIRFLEELGLKHEVLQAALFEASKNIGFEEASQRLKEQYDLGNIPAELTEGTNLDFLSRLCPEEPDLAACAAVKAAEGVADVRKFGFKDDEMRGQVGAVEETLGEAGARRNYDSDLLANGGSKGAADIPLTEAGAAEACCSDADMMRNGARCCGHLGAVDEALGEAGCRPVKDSDLLANGGAKSKADIPLTEAGAAEACCSDADMLKNGARCCRGHMGAVEEALGKAGCTEATDSDLLANGGAKSQADIPLTEAGAAEACCSDTDMLKNGARCCGHLGAVDEALRDAGCKPIHDSDLLSVNGGDLLFEQKLLMDNGGFRVKTDDENLGAAGAAARQ